MRKTSNNREYDERSREKYVVASLKQFVSDQENGIGCLCDPTILFDPFYLRMAVLLHQRVYVPDVEAFWHAGMPSQSARDSLDEAYKAKAFYSVSPFDYLSSLERELFHYNLEQCDVQFDEYEKVRDKKVEPPLIDWRSLDQLRKNKGQTLYEMGLKPSVDPTRKFEKILRHFRIWAKSGGKEIMSDDEERSVSHRALLLFTILPCLARGWIRLFRTKEEEIHIELNESELNILEDAYYASIVPFFGMPFLSTRKNLGQLMKAAGNNFFYLSSFWLPQIRDIIMNMSFSELTHPSGRLQLLPKIVRSLNEVSKQLSSYRELLGRITSIIDSYHKEITTEFKLENTLVDVNVTESSGTLSSGFQGHSPDAVNYVPAYIQRRIEELLKEELKTREITVKKIVEMKKALENIRVLVKGIKTKDNGTILAHGEIEITIPFAPGVFYKIHLPSGELDYTDIVRARAAITKKVEEALAEIKKKSIRVFKSLSSMKTQIVQGILDKLLKA